MLRTILSITGRPGLYKLLSQGNNIIVVEDVTTGKRLPVHQRDKIISLGDVAMYTEAEDLPLDRILQRLYDAHQGAAIEYKGLPGDSLREIFAEVVPDFDRDRVHTGDIKKLFQWYNILVNAGFTAFVEEEKEEEKVETKEESAE